MRDFFTFFYDSIKGVFDLIDFIARVVLCLGIAFILFIIISIL